MSSDNYTRYLRWFIPYNSDPLNKYEFKEKHIGDLAVVNLFVGINNAGKSRFLRNLFSAKDLEFETNTQLARKLTDFLKQIDTGFKTLFDGQIIGISGFKKDTFEIHFKNPISIKPARPIYTELENILNQMIRASNAIETEAGAVVGGSYSYVDKMKQFGTVVFKQFKEQLNQKEFLNATALNNAKRFYLPILRGMRPLNQQTNIYHERTKKDYFSELAENHIIFTGLELYQTLKEKLLGEPDDRKAVKEFEDFLSRNFFNSDGVALIPHEQHDTVHVKIGHEKQLPIYNLGDGLQSLIITTFNMFMERNTCLFFIEEPDICMHPGLQRAFLDVLLQMKQHQYFITTHSNHFLDMTLDFSDISVFLFNKVSDAEDPKFKVSLMSSKDHNLLRELGVKNSSVFLTNATVWVEGITDRLYLRAYLVKFLKELKDSDKETYDKYKNFIEDFHYSFVEYQGASLPHWSFNKDSDGKYINADVLCAPAILIADGDVASKGNRREEFKKMLGDKFEVLPCKEIENLLPPEILKQVVKDIFAKYNKDPEVTIRYKEYSKPKKGLGKYLDRLIGASNEYATESGTVKNKVRFCEKAIETMSDPDISWALTPELSAICEKIFKHIEERNRPDA